MKNRKLKSFVLPSLYVGVITILFIGIIYLGASLQTKQNNGDMSVNAIIEESVPVISTDEEQKPETLEVQIVKPFNSDKVSISKSFYDMQDEEQKQENSLVYYENTYLQNSGVLYSSDEVFDIINTLDGTITNITKDDILGNVVEITHNPNLKTIFYSLSEINVKKDDVITTNTIIGKSGNNALGKEKENCLLIEVYYKGSAIDPEDYYNMKPEELQ